MKLLRLAPEKTNFPFMRFRRVSYPFSAFMSIVSVLLFIFIGMNFGIDFAGGTLIELRARTGAGRCRAIARAGRASQPRRDRGAELRQFFRRDCSLRASAGRRRGAERGGRER
jgi:preprotein translocase subunit SecF